MIAVNQITKRYGKITAIADISFTIEKGQVVGLLGLNGAGKSTTMNIIAGCIRADDGSVIIDDIDMAQNPKAAKCKIGYLPEIPPLYQDMKVLEYLNFVYELKRVKEPQKEHILACTTMVGLEMMLPRLIRNLSKGYKQRVGFAAALIGNPEVLILDEPTVGLDPRQMIEIRSLIEELGHTKTVILSSHILTEVQAVCERIIIINKGQVIADNTSKQLEKEMMRDVEYAISVWGDETKALRCLQSIAGISNIKIIDREKEEVLFSICGAGEAVVRKEIAKCLVKAGLSITAMLPVEISLEDVFLKLVTQGGQL